MTKRNRRQFLEDSMLAAAAAAASTSGVDTLLAAPPTVSRSVNEQLGVAVIGVRGRGNSHLNNYATRRDARVLYVCDVDREVGMRRIAQMAKRYGGPAPRYEEDLRHVLDDPRVDIISVAASTCASMESGR